jgi:hypothetical protein
MRSDYLMAPVDTNISRLSTTGLYISGAGALGRHFALKMEPETVGSAAHNCTVLPVRNRMSTGLQLPSVQAPLLDEPFVTSIATVLTVGHHGDLSVYSDKGQWLVTWPVTAPMNWMVKSHGISFCLMNRSVSRHMTICLGRGVPRCSPTGSHLHQTVWRLRWPLLSEMRYLCTLITVINYLKI